MVYSHIVIVVRTDPVVRQPSVRQHQEKLVGELRVMLEQTEGTFTHVLQGELTQGVVVEYTREGLVRVLPVLLGDVLLHVEQERYSQRVTLLYRPPANQRVLPRDHNSGGASTVQRGSVACYI